MVADVAHVLATPIPALLEMDFDDLMLWHEEAARIVRATGTSRG